VFADYDVTVTIVAVTEAMVMIPATMPTAVLIVEPDARPVIAVAVVAMVAANVDTEAGRVGNGRSADRKCRCRRKCVSELSHVFLLSLGGITNKGTVPLREPARNFLEGTFRKFRSGADANKQRPGP
jgi:hypothetical protein